MINQKGLFTGIIIIIVLVGGALGAVMALQKGANTRTVPSDNIPAQKPVYQYQFTPPAGWQFAKSDQKNTFPIDRSEDPDYYIALEHSATGVQMDLHIQNDADDDDVPAFAFKQAALPNESNAWISQEPCEDDEVIPLYIEDSMGKALYIEVQEVCEFEKGRQMNLQKLLREVAAGFTIIVQ